jgi:hypothetical protein
MPDQRPEVTGPDGPVDGAVDGAVDGVVHEVARELLGVLPFGLTTAALARCPRLTALIGPPAVAGKERCGDAHTTATIVEAIESMTDPTVLPHHPEPVAPAVARHMLHVLLASRDVSWPGRDSPLGVRRVAAADLYFDATQTVLADHDWRGPHGVEFALLTGLAERICRTAALRATARAAEVRARDACGERLGQLHRVHPPRGF